MSESNSSENEKNSIPQINSSSSKIKLDVNWKVFWIGVLTLLILTLILGLISKNLLKSNVIPIATIFFCGIFLSSIFVAKFTNIKHKFLANSFSFSLGWMTVFSFIRFFIK